MSPRRSIAAASIGLAFGFIFWTALTLTGDGFGLHNLVLQRRAAGYPTTTGFVQQSSSVYRGGKGNRYELHVRYTYELNGRSFTGSRYRYGMESRTRQDVAKLLTTLTPGSEIAVHYNPRDPSDAVLVVGIQPQDLFLFHFLMPFNCVMLIGWITLGRAVWCWVAGLPAGCARVTERNGRTRVDFSADRHWIAPLIVLGALTFLTTLAVVFPFGFNPSWLVLVVTWSLIAAGVLVLAGRLASAISEQVLVLDQGSRMLELVPPGARHKANANRVVAIPFSTIADITVERVTAKESAIVYVPTLRVRRNDGQCETHELIQWTNAAAAQWLIGWLRERILGEPTVPQAAR